MRRFNISQQQQQPIQGPKFLSQQVNARNSVYNNRQLQQQQQQQQLSLHQYNNYDRTYGSTSPLAKPQQPANPKNEKLQAAREAREKLDLYRSFEEDEDYEFYPHQQYGNYSLEDSSVSSSSHRIPIPSAADLYSSRQPQLSQQQIFRSPLSTPERSNFQSSLNSNKLYSASVSNVNDLYYSSPSPQRLNVNVVHNNSSTPLSNRSLMGRPQTGQLYYTPQNSGRSRY